MPKYLLSYHGGHFPPELAEDVGRNWTRWMDPIAAKFVDRGGPLETSRTIGAGGVVQETGPHETTGYSIIEADSLDTAIAIAKGCPQLLPPHKEGTIEVAELMMT